MAKARKRSLASRKRAKDVRSATLDYAMTNNRKANAAFDPKWESALTRKARLLVKGAPPRHSLKPDEGRRIVKKKKPPPTSHTPAAAATTTTTVAAPRVSAASASHNASSRLDVKLTKPKPSDRPNGADRKAGATAASRPPKFGETNDRPPELLLIGQLAAALHKKGRRATEDRAALAAHAAMSVGDVQQPSGGSLPKKRRKTVESANH